MQNLNNEEKSRYNFLGFIVAITFIIFILSFGYFLFLFIRSMVYWYMNDTLSVMQVFKVYINRFIINLIIYIIDTSVMKNSFEEWKILDKKKNEDDNKLHIVR